MLKHADNRSLNLINSLHIKNFRNHQDLALINLNSSVVILGNNGSGKTSILEAISIFSNSRGFRSSKMIEMLNKNKISAENPDQGSAEEDVNVHYEGEDLDIGFNSKYLLDIARQVNGAHIKFLMSDNLSPTLIFDGDDNLALYLLMPMHI